MEVFLSSLFCDTFLRVPANENLLDRFMSDIERVMSSDDNCAM